MSDDWDAEDFEPAPVAATKESLKESWEDEDVEEEEAQPSSQPTQPASTAATTEKKKKKKAESAKEVENAVSQDSEVLSDPVAEKLRQQRLVEESDFKSAKELFGGKKSKEEKSIEDFLPKSEQDFIEFAELLASKATLHAKSIHYPLLLKTFLRQAVTPVGTKEAKDVSATATVLWNEKLKAEKEAQAGKKKGGAKKQQLKVDSEENYGAGAGAGIGPDDDYDFM